MRCHDQITAFAVDHSAAQAASPLPPSPQKRRPLVFRNLCVVEKAYQVMVFGDGDGGAQASD
jgi:hypothetical protein